MIVLKSKQSSVFIAIFKELLIALATFAFVFGVYKLCGGERTFAKVWPGVLGFFIWRISSSLQNWRIRKILIDSDNKIITCWYRTAFSGIAEKAFPFQTSKVKFERTRKWGFGTKKLSEVKLIDEKGAFIRIGKSKDGMDINELEQYLLPLTSAVEVRKTGEM